ncbi:hypothetical protein NXT3_PB00181 (plasmid) [Sinorhizobium fredii]|uniref:Uncharacterized protein n=1 Tax=Rhizobium fredii TaxID=380 RepID=A0A2L0HCE8_RHIFR|nr:hypothetical protein NXT3_PB00181 [Sinorhizobium fredii]
MIHIRRHILNLLVDGDGELKTSAARLNSSRENLLPDDRRDCMQEALQPDAACRLSKRKVAARMKLTR